MATREHLMVILSFLFLGLSLGSPSWANSSCECPKLECSPCEEESGLTFFSEKCGPNNAQVKSCARPTCVPKESPPASCEAKAQADPPKDSSRQVASVQSEPEVRGPQIGSVKSVAGIVWLKAPGEAPVKMRTGEAVHEKDRMWADRGGLAQVEFLDGNAVHVLHASEIKVEEYKPAQNPNDQKKALIELIRGRVRAQVKQKYDGTPQSSFSVRTRAAVAGVRGTDFVVSLSEGEKIETRIDTLEGKVVLSGHGETEKIEISAGEHASYVVAKNDLFDEQAISEFVARGHLTPVFKTSPNDLKNLDAETHVGPRALVAKAKPSSDSVCESPKGDINQCLWTCMNNPKGESRCRVERAEVSCVRRRCNANGEWAEETRLPAALSGSCQAQPTIAPCDY